MQAKRRAKNMERMEEHVAGFDYQCVQNFISDSPWEHRPLMDEIARRASGLLGGAARTRLVVDDTGIQKKGHKSVGVARQYLGRLGKVEKRVKDQVRRRRKTRETRPPLQADENHPLITA